MFSDGLDSERPSGGDGGGGESVEMVGVEPEQRKSGSDIVVTTDLNMM